MLQLVACGDFWSSAPTSHPSPCSSALSHLRERRYVEPQERGLTAKGSFAWAPVERGTSGTRGGGGCTHGMHGRSRMTIRRGAECLYVGVYRCNVAPRIFSLFARLLSFTWNMFRSIVPGMSQYVTRGRMPFLFCFRVTDAPHWARPS